MCSLVTENDIYNYGLKIKDVKNIEYLVKFFFIIFIIVYSILGIGMINIIYNNISLLNYKCYNYI